MGLEHGSIVNVPDTNAQYKLKEHAYIDEHTVLLRRLTIASFVFLDWDKVRALVN